MELFGAIDALVDLGWLIKTFGPWLVAVVFFLWRDFKREDKLSKRINELEDEQRKVILPLVKDCSEVITRNTVVMEQNIKVMERLEVSLNRS